MTRMDKTIAALARLEIANCGRWCEVVLKSNGNKVRVERVGYGPMEWPEFDAHKIYVNGSEVAEREFKNLAEVAAWMLYEN